MLERLLRNLAFEDSEGLFDLSAVVVENRSCFTERNTSLRHGWSKDDK